MCIDRLMEDQNNHFRTVAFDQFHSQQEVVHSIQNLAKVTPIELDDHHVVLLIYPATHDVSANRVIAHFGSGSFRRLEETEVTTVDGIAVCDSLGGYENIVLGVGDYQSGIEFSVHELCNNRLTDVFQFSGLKKYKARIKQVAPETARDTFLQCEKCFVGFSLESGSFTGNRLVAVMKWIDSHFSECLVLIADSIHNNTIQMERHVSLKKSLSITNALAQSAIDECEAIIGGLNHCRFIVSRASRYIPEPGYASTLTSLYNLYECSANFRDSVNHFSKNFAHRKNVERIRFVELSKKYLLEELAVTSCLIAEGWTTLVYPGELNAFDEIANGLHPGVPELLKQLTSVSLTFRPAGQDSH
ncbi:tRNA-dependent cyclodipeptide synthase [Ketobacter sp. MCCC 1A13808]|uniref:tRNA-dependent cyclodipeptide synthase n=1 Tax=Ketobacter sp. MCCC 1A13808 TaxID=2602738 RepID=UPI000F12AC54|nr:tRNA-dependent cyclodipeptide synthase [Ketobacter sp. MCCC 1A13808]MVF11450.1 tRNA-dependent cyclodipeptide synthase [Ketobacter sp. MCCC 1A13808]RLP54594.1 MAG: tRNA-dependent cyclodipeptide synthase [Ketobacter sp.]